MSILIKGMELPEDKEIFLRIDEKGEVYVYGSYPTELHKAVPVPPHGDLIDRSELQSTVMQVVTKFPTSNFAAIEHLDLVSALLRGATVVVPAERSEP